VKVPKKTHKGTKTYRFRIVEEGELEVLARNKNEARKLAWQVWVNDVDRKKYISIEQVQDLDIIFTFDPKTS